MPQWRGLRGATSFADYPLPSRSAVHSPFAYSCTEYHLRTEKTSLHLSLHPQPGLGAISPIFYYGKGEEELEEEEEKEEEEQKECA